MSTTALRTSLRALTESFTDSVMDAIRGASLEDLLGETPRDAGRPTGTPRASTAQGTASSLTELNREASGQTSSHSARGRPRRSSLVAAEMTTDAAPTASHAPPAPAAEITDPQGLLAMGVHEPLRAAEPEIARERVPEGPTSTVRAIEAGSPVRLRANETLAKVSNAGIVIRRAK
jgi:hypothetical protein